MKIRHAVLVLSLVLLFAGASFAQVVDPPRIIFGNVENFNTFTVSACTPTADVTEPCTAALDTSGDATLSITNDIRAGLSDLTITVGCTLIAGGATCDAAKLGSTPDPCQIAGYDNFGFTSHTQTSPWACNFSGGSVGLNDIIVLALKGYCTAQPCSTGNPSLGAVNFSIDVPEPSTILLLWMGLAAVMVWRKRVKSITQDA
jgi:hypothetical protein